MFSSRANFVQWYKNISVAYIPLSHYDHIQCTVRRIRSEIWRSVSTQADTYVEHSLLLIPLAVMAYHQLPLYFSNTPRASCTVLCGFTMTTASSSHQTQAFPTLLHSSSLRMCLTECRVFSTAHTSNKQHTI